jgi:hypothetical protein
MAYISEETVQAAADQAQAAQQEADAIAQQASRDTDWQKNHTQAEARARTLRVRAEGLAAERSRYEQQSAARKATVKRMQGELRDMWTALTASMAALNAATQSGNPGNIRAQATAHNSRIQEYNARLANSGLYAVDDLTEPGTHHEFGSNGHRGLYLGNVEWIPREGLYISIVLLAAAYDAPGWGGSPELQKLRQLGQIARQHGRLEGGSDGFTLLPNTTDLPSDNGQQAATASRKKA